MAVVRFSSRLIQDITENAKKVFVNKLDDAKKVDPEIPDRMMDHILAPWLAQMNLLDPMFEKCSCFTLASINDVDVHATLRFKTERILPYRYPSTSPFKAGWNNQNGNYTVRSNNPTDLEFYEYFKNRRDRILKVGLDERYFISGIERVCESFTTLAPALKAWPPLWDYIPQHTKRIHLKTVDKTTREKATIPSDLDVSKLTAVAVASKLVR